MTTETKELWQQDAYSSIIWKYGERKGRRITIAINADNVNALEADRAELAEALRACKDHVDELAEAWQRGVMREGDGLGGTRSNRNADLAYRLRLLLARLDKAASA